MILEQHEDGSYTTRGIEGNLYRELSKRLNFSMLVRVGHEIYVGSTKENFEMLRKGEVNLTMFAVVNTVDRSKRFTASSPYTYTSLVFTIPEPPPYSPKKAIATIQITSLDMSLNFHWSCNEHNILYVWILKEMETLCVWSK